MHLTESLKVCVLLIAACICQDKEASGDLFNTQSLNNLTLDTFKLPGLKETAATTEGSVQQGGKTEQNITLDVKKHIILDPISVKLLRGEEDSIMVSDLSLLQPMYLLNQSSIKVWSVDYHYTKGLIYFTALDKIYRCKVVGRLQRASEPQVVVGVGVDGPMSIVVDWVHDKLYWMSEKHQTVEMADLDGSNRTLLIDNLQNNSRYPNNIALDPYKGYMFLVNNFSIYRMRLTERHLTMIALEGQQQRGVNCIALDTQKQRLYYSGKMKDFNTGLPFLASSDYNGQTVKDHPLTNPRVWYDIFSLAVFRDTLYFAHWDGPNRKNPNSIYKLNLSQSPATPRKFPVASVRGMITVVDHSMKVDRATALIPENLNKVNYKNVNKLNLWNIRVYHPGVQQSPAEEEVQTDSD